MRERPTGRSAPMSTARHSSTPWSERTSPSAPVRGESLPHGKRGCSTSSGRSCGLTCMTITSDETPRVANGAEGTVYETRLDQLHRNEQVILAQRMTGHLKDDDVDFVVAIACRQFVARCTAIPIDHSTVMA